MSYKDKPTIIKVWRWIELISIFMFFISLWAFNEGGYDDFSAPNKLENIDRIETFWIMIVSFIIMVISLIIENKMTANWNRRMK